MELEPPEVTTAMNKSLLHSASAITGNDASVGIKEISTYYNLTNTTGTTVLFQGAVSDIPYSIDRNFAECSLKFDGKWQCSAGKKHYISLKAQAEFI